MIHLKWTFFRLQDSAGVFGRILIPFDFDSTSKCFFILFLCLIPCSQKYQHFS